MRLLRTTPSLCEDEQELEFLIEHSGGTTVGDGQAQTRVSYSYSPEQMLDGVVRSVAVAQSATRTDFVDDGIGHAAVGWLFGQSLSFLVDLESARTTSGAAQRRMSPDMSDWPEHVVSSALEGMTPPPLLAMARTSASKLAITDRAAAWSVVDYMLRRDPALLLVLDEAGQQRGLEKAARTFQSGAGFPAEVFEADWRLQRLDDWGAEGWSAGGESVLECATREGERWLEALVETRRKLLEHDRAVPQSLRWSAPRALLCRQHARYLTANGITDDGPQAQTQSFARDGATVAGRRFASRALVGFGRGPRAALEHWLHLPDYRHALLDPYLEVVGLHADGTVAVCDFAAASAQGCEPEHEAWPRPGAVVPRSLEVATCGEHLREQLAAHGRGAASTVGYPVSYHLWPSGHDLSAVRCTVECRGKPVDGLLLCEVGLRLPHVPGTVTFVPFESLEKGGVMVRFEQDDDGDGEFEELLAMTFTAR